MAITGYEGRVKHKKDILESRAITKAAKKVVFAHQASGGETSLNLLSLTAPTELTSNGFVNASSADLAAANLIFNKKALRLRSSRGIELQQYSNYIITTSTSLTFINGFVAQPGEIFVGEIDALPINSTFVADFRQFDVTVEVAVGVTLVSLGTIYKVNDNPTQQTGAIKVYRNGQRIYRNAANATASPTADGNYQEVDSGNGYGTTIQLNIAPSGQPDVIGIDFGIQSGQPNVELFGSMETLYGAVLALATDAASGFGNPITNYISANPTAVERRAFGNILLGILDMPVPIVTDPMSYAPTFTGFGTPAAVNFVSWRNGKYLFVEGTFTAGTNTPVEARISLGYNGLDGNAITVSTLPTLSVVGKMKGGTPSATYFATQTILTEASKNYFTISADNSSVSLAKSNGNDLHSSLTYSLYAKFQIDGWSATQTLRQYLQSKGIVV